MGAISEPSHGTLLDFGGGVEKVKARTW